MIIFFINKVGNSIYIPKNCPKMRNKLQCSTIRVIIYPCTNKQFFSYYLNKK